MSAAVQPQRIEFEKWWSKELTQCKQAVSLSEELQKELYAVLQLSECPYGDRCNHKDRKTGCYHMHASGEEFPKTPADMNEKLRSAYMSLCNAIVSQYPEAVGHLTQYVKAKEDGK